MYCLRCRYNLRGLPEPRCPECGTRFDAADPLTFRSSPFPAYQICIARFMAACDKWWFYAGSAFFFVVAAVFAKPWWFRIEFALLAGLGVFNTVRRVTHGPKRWKALGVDLVEMDANSEDDAPVDRR